MSIESELRDLKRRLTSLERATRLDFASVEGTDGEQVDVKPAILSASGALAQALSAEVAKAAADGLVTIFYDSEEPTIFQEGDLWVQPNGLLDKAIGGAWVDYSNQALADALVRAQNTADDKTRTFWTPTAPVTGDHGDLWFETAPNPDPLAVAPVVMRMWRWDSTIPAWMELPLGTLQTPTYVEGTTGVRLDEETAQFENVNVTSELGADTASFQNLLVEGEDIMAPVHASAGGYVSYARFGMTTGSDTKATGLTEAGLIEFNGGNIKAGRLYRMHLHGHFEATVANEPYDWRIRYTTDGTPVALNSAILDGSLTRIVSPNGSPAMAFQVVCYYAPLVDYETTRFLLTLKKAAGTGVGNIYLTDINRAFEWFLEDLGDYTLDKTQQELVAQGGTGVMSQKSKAPTTAAPTVDPPPDPDPVQSYTRSWYADWSRSFDGDDGTRNGDDTNDCYQGYVSGTHGNTKSLFGFNDEQIRQYLAGATVKSIKLTFKVKHAWSYAGATIRINSHNYDEKPSSWSEANVNEARASRSGCKEGSSYTVTLPIAVGNEFKSGTTKGLGFGPGASTSAATYYAYMYGEGSASRPKLTITYVK